MNYSEKTKQIKRCEEYLTSIGFSKCKVMHFNTTAKIELPLRDLIRCVLLSKRIREEFQKIGFNHVTLDLKGMTN